MTEPPPKPAPFEGPTPAARASTQSLARALQEALPGGLSAMEGCQPAGLLSGVFQDAREVTPGSLFVARAGRKTHGVQYVGEALARGARAVLTDTGAHLPSECPCVLRTPEVGQALAVAAAHVYDDPTRRLKLVGVTGTNGKTSTVWAVAQALEALGLSTARLGTVGLQWGTEVLPSSLTTPEADTSLRFLNRAVREGARYAVMEVSNVALETQRVSGFDFDVVALTNLSRDHLDYHGSFEAYRAAKARLFLEYGARTWVVNAGDVFGRWLAERAGSNGARLLRAGPAGPAGGSGEAELSWSQLQQSSTGVRGHWRLHPSVRAQADPGLGFEGWLESPWLGAHNFENLVLALGILTALEIEPPRAALALAGVSPPPGRLERITGPEHAFQVVVDYAHTDDALSRVLRTLRPLTDGRLLCLFGCGGDRDPGKREPMGNVVGALADRAWLCSDNPRSEDPAKIAAQVERGLRRAGGRYEVVLDRAQAIEQAVLAAQPGDVLVVAGKGHETQQHLAHGSVAFDDREHVRAALRRRAVLPTHSI